MKKFVVIKDGCVFWGSVTPKQIISTYTNIRNWAVKLTFKNALRVSKMYNNSEILTLEEFKEYKLNGE